MGLTDEGSASSRIEVDKTKRVKRRAKNRSTSPNTIGKKRLFLAKFIDLGGIITPAALAAGISRKTFYDWMARDPKFAAEYEQARQDATDAIESEVVRRAIHGTEEPVFYQGQQCGTIKRYSDALLVALMKSRKPVEYGTKADVTIATVPIKIYKGVDIDRV